MPGLFGMADQSTTGFAKNEIFIVAPILLSVGVATSFLLRWFFVSTHWTTWIPAAVCGVPFLIVYGLIVPMIIWMWVSGKHSASN